MNLIEGSKHIIQKAIKDFNPYAVVLMLSGGDDSMAAFHVCKELDVKIDFILHGVTGTGIKETHDFVHSVVKGEEIKYIEANAGSAYEDYVLRKGFFGVGVKAHTYSYHILKGGPFGKALSQNIRQGVKGRKILLINGARRQESANRMKTMINPIKVYENNVWVNIINEWPNKSCEQYLEGNSIERNPVSKLICRSGECNCGTMLNKGDRIEIGMHFPEWKKWIDSLSDAVVTKGFDWAWGENLPKGLAMEKKGQLNIFTPMCSSCEISYSKSVSLEPES